MRVPALPYNPVQAAPLPGVRMDQNASPDQFGAGIGRGISSLGGDVAEIAIKAKQEADDVAVNDRTNQFDTLNNKQLAEARQMQGQNALDLPKTVNDNIDKYASDISSTLTNDTQKRLFAQVVAGRRVAANRFIDDHVATQAAAYREETYNEGLKNSLDTVGLHYGDEAVVNAAINDSLGRTDRYAKAAGKSPEWVQQQNKAIVSGAHAEVISRFVTDENTDAATQYFNRYKEELSPKDQQIAQAKLSGAVDMKKSQAAVDEIMAKPGDYNGGIGLQQGLDEIRDKYKDDPRARAMAEQRWVSSYQMRESAVKDENNATYNRILSGMLDPNNPSGLDNADMVDRTNLLQRDPAAYEKLSNYDAMRKRREEVKTDPARWLEINDLINNRPEEAKKLIMTKEINALSTSDIKEIQGRIDKLGTGDGGTKESMIDKVAQEELTLAGQKPSDADKVTYLRAVRDAVNAPGGPEKPVSREQVQKIAGQLLADRVTSKGFVWDTKTPTYKIPEAVAAIRPGDGALPPDHVVAVTDALKDPAKREDVLTSIKSWQNDPKTEGRIKQISDSVMAPADRFLGNKVLKARLGRDPTETELLDWVYRARDAMQAQKAAEERGAVDQAWADGQIGAL